MDTFKKKMLFLIAGALIVLSVGISIFSALLVAFNKYNGKYDKDNPVYATVVEIQTDSDDDHTVYVDYEYDGEEFTHRKMGYYSSSMHEGGKVKIYVNPDRPSDFTAAGTGIVLIIVAIVTGIVCIVFLVVFFLVGIGTVKNKRIGTGGAKSRVVARITEIKSFTDKNGCLSYEIMCQYIDKNSVIYNFARHHITEEQIQRFAIGQEIAVSIIDGDFGNYIVEL